MDDAAADVPKRLFIPRFPLLPLDGYVASSVHSSLRELVYRRNYGIYVISYVLIYIYPFFFPFFFPKGRESTSVRMERMVGESPRDSDQSHRA